MRMLRNARRKELAFRIGPPTLTPNSFTVELVSLHYFRRLLGMKKVIGCVEQGAVPYLVHVSVKPVRSRLGEVVDLRGSVTSQVERIYWYSRSLPAKHPAR